MSIIETGKEGENRTMTDAMEIARALKRISEATFAIADSISDLAKVQRDFASELAKINDKLKREK